MLAEMLPWDGCVSFLVLSFSLNCTNLIFSHGKSCCACAAPAAVAPVVAAPLVLPKREEEEREWRMNLLMMTTKRKRMENESINDDDDDISAPSVWSESRCSQADSVVDENATPTSAMLGSSLAAIYGRCIICGNQLV